jgi:hypothetical protein
MQSIIPKSSVTNGRRFSSDSIERKLNKSSSSSFSDNSSSESGIPSLSDNASLVDLLSGDSSEPNSSDSSNIENNVIIFYHFDFRASKFHICSRIHILRYYSA